MAHPLAPFFRCKKRYFVVDIIPNPTTLKIQRTKHPDPVLRRGLFDCANGIGYLTNKKSLPRLRSGQAKFHIQHIDILANKKSPSKRISFSLAIPIAIGTKPLPPFKEDNTTRLRSALVAEPPHKY
jgi:hypothetical protein